MRLHGFLVSLLLGSLALAAAAAAERPPATVAVTECVIKDDGDRGRSATFRGVMHAVRGSSRMQMRFTLLEKTGAGGFEALRQPELATWQRSRPGVKVFAYDQRVAGLRAGGSYRVRVAFRWLGADGTVVRRLARRSDSCRQPGALPNLTISGITWGPGPRPATADYVVEVTNSGGSSASGARVVLRVDGALVDSSDSPALGPGETAAVRFTGPVCSDSVRAVVDPHGAIRESDERDNSLARGCAG